MAFCLALAAAISLGYAYAFVWLLRDELPRTLAVLAVVLGCALALRCVWPAQYPNGWSDDEPQHFQSAQIAYASGHPVQPGTDGGVDVLTAALFAAPLAPLMPYVGKRAVIRGYAILASVLACAAGFVLARACGLCPVASLTVAALLAVLPWTIFYGRQAAEGGELTLNYLLLGTALVRLLTVPRAGVREVLLGTGALALLVYGYWAGLVALAWPCWAALLQRRRAAHCILIVVLALILSAPWWRTTWQVHAVALAFAGHTPPSDRPSWALTPGLLDHPVQTLLARYWFAVRSLWEPLAQDFIYSRPMVALHPIIVLLTAAVGWITLRPRIVLLLLGGCLLGVAPGALSGLPLINWHRSLLGLPFVAIAAGASLMLVPAGPWRVTAALVLLIPATLDSIRLAFFDALWAPYPFPY